MKKSEYEKNNLIRMNDGIYRILAIKDSSYLCIDCLNRTMPKWYSLNDLKISSLCREEDLLTETGFYTRSMEELSAEEKRIVYEKYYVVAFILPFIDDDKRRLQAIRVISEEKKISRRSVVNYLCMYLVYQKITVFAPKVTMTKNLTEDQKNIRWALNKFFYTRHGNSLTDAFVMMLKAKYCDEAGNLLPEHPSIYQFKYYYRTHKSIQKKIISQEGIKEYEMNYRPLLGENIQQFAPAVGVGLLDSTIADIYLCDEAGNNVGRPFITACIDAYSGLCCGYSVSFEGGLYSLRDLMVNCITDKVKHCEKFGILIDKEDWDCNELMGTYVTDKGSEYKSYNFEQLTELGCHIINLPSFRPELKGSVERFFNLLQESYKPYLKGKGVIEKDFQKRGAHDYRKDACLTVEQFTQILLRCIIFYNKRRIIEKFPYTEDMLNRGIKPYSSDLWNYGKFQDGANLIKVTKEQLVLNLLPRTSAKFKRNGLIVNGLRYKADGYTEKFLSGGNATVAYNPENSVSVWLIEENGEYIQFDLIESRFKGKNLSEVQELQKRQKEFVRNYSEENLQARINLARHIETIASQSKYGEEANIVNIKKSRQKQKDMKHKDFMEELSEDTANFGDKEVEIVDE